MKTVAVILSLILSSGIIPSGPVWTRQLQPRDSILVADQIEYGFQLDSVKTGTVLSVPDFAPLCNDTLLLVRGWQIDTLKSYGRRKSPTSFNIRGTVVLAPFEEGLYELPDVPVQVTLASSVDTLVFEGIEMEVKTMPVDTATFEIHDIKGQIVYPLTFRELAPWSAGVLLLAAIVFFLVRLISRAIAAKRGELLSRSDPPHIVALRELDKFRSYKYWEPEKQKAFYSGITDALKNYMDARFGVDAPEMTTAELFASLKDCRELKPELYTEMKELFEKADFVKFAKFTVPREENAGVLPAAVRFVTDTYQEEIEGEEARSE